MNKFKLIATFAVILICGGVASYFYFQDTSPPVKVAVKAPPQPKIEVPKPQEPQKPQIVEPVPVQTPLPKLAESDSFILDALTELVSNKKLMKLFETEKIIRNIVATVDNLTRNKLPSRLLPINQPGGKFITTGGEETLAISSRNAARYAPYMKLIEVIDTKKLIEIYTRLYPLFQETYQELGYPNKYFNDRLLEVIDDLLDVPDVNEPVKLVQPNVFYLYADPDLEELSIGQRILIRIGNKNAEKIKSKLTEFKKELALHMHDKKIS